MSASENMVEAAVTEVTLLEDRAHVVRRGRLSVKKGTCRLTVSDVAPVLADKTLSANVGDDAPCRINDVRVVRNRRVTDQQKPEELRRLEQEHRAAAAELEKTAAEKLALEEHLEGLGLAAKLTMDELAEDASWGRVEGAQWESKLDLLASADRDVIRALADISLKIVQTQKKVADLSARRSSAIGPGAELEASLCIEVLADADTDLDIRIDYVVPGACWRPYHIARLVDGSPCRVHFRSDGCVWQNTGEDWNDVDLVFSTERPSLGVEPPDLSSDVVRSQRRGAAVFVEAREQKVHVAGLDADEEVSPELPGIDDGGEVVKLRSRTKATVPSDGRPYRIETQSFETPAEVSLVLMAELVPAAILKSVQSNTARAPILAGPVDLVHNSGFVGRTSLLFVASGEKFELGWGPDPVLSVLRETERLDDETKVLSSWTTVPHRVRLAISNTGPEKRAIEVTERIPVSELEKVSISFDRKRTSDRAKPDDDGFVRWRVELDAFGQRKLDLAYEVKKHADVVGI